MAFLKPILSLVIFLSLSSAASIHDLSTIVATPFSKLSRTARACPGFNPDNYVKIDGFFSWATANETCELVHPDLRLLAVESQAESEFIKCFLLEHNDGGNFWTSGSYDPLARQFKWDTNGVPLSPWAPYAPGHPPSFPTMQSKVYIHETVLGDVAWQVGSSTDELFSIICERNDPTIPVPCPKETDVMILLDSSSSITDEWYPIALEFAAKLSKAFSDFPGTRVGFAIFSDIVMPIVPLNSALTPDGIEQAILAAPYLASGTLTAAAVREAIAQYAANERPGIRKNVITITDGESNDPADTIAAANAAIAAGLQLHSVAIRVPDNAELLKLAGDDPNRAFRTDEFDQLLKLLYPVSLKVCPI